MTDKKSQLEVAAIDAVQHSGLSSLSFRTLAEKVGVKSASVHYHFPAKPDLARALIEKYSSDFATVLSEIDRREQKPAKKLEAFVDIFEDVLKEDKFCLCGMMAAEVSNLDDSSRKLLDDYFENAEAWLSKIFETNAEKTTSTLKPKVLAKIVLSGLEGAILIDRIEGDSARLRAQRAMVKSLIA